MTHLAEGTILVVRDAGTVDEEALEHLDGCDTCLDLLEEAKDRSNLISEALYALDDPVDTARAKTAVRARLDGLRAPYPMSGKRRWHLGRAAAILILTAGAASALPWSPTRSWWERSPSDLDPAQAGTVSPSQTVPAGGIAVEVADGRILVVVRGATPGSDLDVTWVDGTTARIAAPAGSSYSYADGRVEVDLVPGTMSVEIPRGAGEASLEVDGVIYVQRSPAGLEVPGPATETTDDAIRFRVPGV